MKLSVKIPLVIGIVVFITTASIIIPIEIIMSNKIRESNFVELDTLVKANSALINSNLERRLAVLFEIANRARTRTMNWELIRPSLIPDIPRIGVLEMMIIYPDNLFHYVSNGNIVPLARASYSQAAFDGKLAVSDVTISQAINRPVVMLASPIFANDEPGAPVSGVLMARQDGNALSDIVDEIETRYPSGFAFMINNEGTIIAHPDHDKVLNQFNILKEAEKDPSLKSMADMAALAIRERIGNGYYKLDGISYKGSFAEVPGRPWILFVVIEEDEIRAELLEVFFILLSIGIACLVAGIITALIIGRSISKPVRYVAKTLEEIAKGDLTIAIDVNSKDEIASMAHYFSVTLDKIRTLIKNIKGAAANLSKIGNDLAVNMNQTATAVNEITANIQSIKGQVTNQSTSVRETHKTMENLVGNIKSLNSHVENQSDNISQASSAIEEMVANINSVTATLVGNAGNVKTLQESSEVGRNGLQEVSENIREIARESEGLLEINSLMENIASQTNLLSMNAAIEAAHAGEAGKGFAVVAGEIRKLAENSSTQSKTIATVLKKIKESIDKITRSTENVLNNFEAIDTSITIVAEQEENIRHAMEEQGIGSKQILDGVGNVNELTRQVKDDSNDMENGARNVIQESGSLEKSTLEITSGMNEMARGADQINDAVNHVNETSHENRDAIDGLIREVERFKVD